MFFSTTIGVLLLPPNELPEVYDGLWGFNGIVAMTALSCVYFAFGSMSFLLGLVNVATTICVHFALRANMTVEVRTQFAYMILGKHSKA